jgi:hypothetical protein
MEESDNIVEENPEYSPKSEFSKAILTSETVKRVLEYRSKEMRPGYYNSTVSKDGSPIKTWVPDSRKTFIASVDALRTFLTPEIERDDKAKKDLQDTEDEIKTIFELYAYREELPFRDQNGAIEWKPTNKLVIPEIDEVIPRPHPTIVNELMPIKGYWNFQTNRYWDSLVPIYDKLFSKLNKLMDRLNYFKPGINYG